MTAIVRSHTTRMPTVDTLRDVRQELRALDPRALDGAPTSHADAHPAHTGSRVPLAQRDAGTSATSSPMLTRHTCVSFPKAEVGPVERAHSEVIFDVTTRGERGSDVGGAGNQLHWEMAALVITDQHSGREHVLLDNRSTIVGQRELFREHGHVAPFPDVEARPLDWHAKRAFLPTGSLGRFASVALRDSAYDGGKASYSRCELFTFDYATGNRVSLQTLLSDDDKTRVVMQLMAQLKQSPELLSGYTEGRGPGEIIHEAMRNFAVFRDETGNAKLTVAIPAGCHATDGTVLQATMDAPRSLLESAEL